MMINAKAIGVGVVLYLPGFFWLIHIVVTGDIDRNPGRLNLNDVVYLGNLALAVTIGSLYRQRLVRKMNLAQLQAEAKKTRESAEISTNVGGRP